MISHALNGDSTPTKCTAASRLRAKIRLSHLDDAERRAYHTADNKLTFANAVTQVGMPQANLTAQLLGLSGATADATNRLSVNTPNVLLNNAGASVDVKMDKNAAANDASFSFKTGFSVRALFGSWAAMISR